MSETNTLVDITSRYINNTQCNVFLTGKAGTGKTTFLRNITQYTHKNVVVAAPTGVAAINARGVTLHSLFHLPFGSFVPVNDNLPSYINFQLNNPQSLLRSLKMNKSKRSLLQELELLIIDEVSMLRADTLDAINTILQSVRREHNKPFGGVQVLFIGDLLQLPPIVKDDEWNLLSHYYQGTFFFHARVLDQTPPLVIELEKVYRQSNPEFLNILNHLRENQLTDSDRQLLNHYVKTDVSETDTKGYIHLTTHNQQADSTNRKHLEKIAGKPYTYHAIIEGDFNENQYPIDEVLELKKGAQVMFIKNDYSGKSLYFNGKIGNVKTLDNESICVEFDDGSPNADVERYTWENKRYKLNADTNVIEEEVIGKFQHFPIKLAWAITVHKSQGLTFTKAIIDVGRSFAPGQVYVALSRLTSLDGLVLLSPLPPALEKQDASVDEFSNHKLTSDELANRFYQYRNTYLFNWALEAFRFDDLLYALRQHKASYADETKKTIKQNYKEWAYGLIEKTLPLKNVADKFVAQLKGIVANRTVDQLPLLQERIDAADNYFQPLLSDLSNSCFEIINELAAQKRVKAFTNEIKDVERCFIAQKQRIFKAKALVKAAMDDSELSKQNFDQKSVQPTRQVEVTPIASKKKKPKAQKGTDTKEISLALWQDGKSIAEIATERSLTQGTITSHLAHFVRLGKIKAEVLLEPAKLRQILTLAEELDTTQLTALKGELDDSYTYEDLRIAMSHLLYTKEQGT